MAVSKRYEDPGALRPYYRLLCIRLLEDAPDGEFRLQIEGRPELENSRGEIHGGVIASLLDAAIGVAVRAAYTENQGATTVSLTINYVAPGRARLIASGQVLRAGGSLASAEAKVVDGTGQLVAHAVGTMRILKGNTPVLPATGT